MIMKKSAHIVLAIVFLLVLATNVHASPTDWKIDPAHSGVYFRVQHIYSAVNGFFPEFEGEIKFDPADLKKSKVFFKVNVKSVNTNNEKRDGHLLSDEFFAAKTYPHMTFESQSIMHKQGNQYVAQGVMKIKDVSKKIDLPFIYFGKKQHPFNAKQEVAGFEAKMTIDRLAYHVGNGNFVKMGVVGQQVDVLVSVEATHDK
jgi:polyisoprenoid-binding protein YceI